MLTKNLTLGEIRALTRLTRAQLRYWSQVLPPLRGKSGRRPCFSPAEAFALRVLAEVVGELTREIAVLAPISNAFFDAVCDGDWQRFEHRRLLIRPRQQVVEFPSDAEALAEWGSGPFVAIELAPHVRAVRGFVLGLPPEPVESRQLPLLDARKRRRTETREKEEGSVS